jgi:hypothetical protein
VKTKLTKTCQFCKHWFTLVSENGKVEGECRRYAPKGGGWPLTSPNDYCNDWEQSK